MGFPSRQPLGPGQKFAKVPHVYKFLPCQAARLTKAVLNKQKALKILVRMFQSPQRAVLAEVPTALANALWGRSECSDVSNYPFPGRTCNGGFSALCVD